MRRLLVVFLVVLSACAVETLPPQSTTSSGVSQQAGRSSDAAFERAVSRIRPIAVSLCRERNPSAKARYCDFRIGLDSDSQGGPNAYQTIGRDGRPIIAFNRAMLNFVRNEDEIAFILGHEAAHQISNHIVKTQATANLGATIFGAIVSAQGGSLQRVQDAADLGGFLGSRAYSKDHELQADVVGTYIALEAGYDPLRGAQSFRRLPSAGGFLATHPASPQRLATVERTVARLRAGQPPRFN